MPLQTPETKRQRAAAQTSPEHAAQPAAESAGGPSATDQPVPAAAVTSTMMMASPATSTMELTGLTALQCTQLCVQHCRQVLTGPSRTQHLQQVEGWCARSAGHTGTFPWRAQASPGVTASIPSLGKPSQQHPTEPSSHCRQPNYRASLTLSPAQHAMTADSTVPNPVLFISQVLRHSLRPLKHPAHTWGCSSCCTLAVSGDLLADQTDSCSLQRAAAVSAGQLQQQPGTVTLEVPQLSTLVEEDEEGPCSTAGVSRGGAAATEGLELTGPTGDRSCIHRGLSEQWEGNCWCQPWQDSATDTLELAGPTGDPTCAEVCLASNQGGAAVSHGRNKATEVVGSRLAPRVGRVAF